MKTPFLIFFLILISKVGLPRDIVITTYGDSVFNYRYCEARKYSKKYKSEKHVILFIFNVLCRLHK